MHIVIKRWGLSAILLGSLNIANATTFYVDLNATGANENSRDIVTLADRHKESTISGKGKKAAIVPTTIETGKFASTMAPPPVLTTDTYTYCLNSSIPTMDNFVTTPAGYATILWYTTPTGGTGSTSTPVSPDPTVAGTSVYYVSAYDPVTTNETPRETLTIIIQAQTAAPTANNVELCQYSTPGNGGITGQIDQLSSATGNNLKWYDAASGGTEYPSPPIPGTLSTGTTSYFVTATDPGSCESPRVEVQVLVHPSPSWPSSSYEEYFCYQESSPTLRNVVAQPGNTLYWYNDPMGTGTTTQPTIDVSVPRQTTRYYVEQRNGFGCGSNLVNVDFIVGPDLQPPVVNSPVTFCVGNTAPPLSDFAIGSNLMWYQTTGGTPGTPTSVAPTVVTDQVKQETWYVYQTLQIGNAVTNYKTCNSAPASIEVNVDNAPAAPQPVTTQVYCQNSAPVLIENPTGDFIWYDMSSGGTGTTRPQTNTTAAGNYSWWIAATNGQYCESARTEVPITITAAPAEPTVPTPPVFCEGQPGGPLAATPATGTALAWYTTVSGGAGVTNPLIAQTDAPGLINDQAYVTSIDANGCESNRVAVPYMVLVNDLPDFSVNDICLNSTLTLTLNGAMPANASWEVDGGQIVSGSGNTRQVRWDVPGTYNVGLIDPSATQCSSARLKTVTVYDVPNVQIAPITAGICANSDITLSASGALTYDWTPKTNMTGGTTATPTVTVIDGAVYAVTGTDANGCANTASITLQSDPNCITYAFPNAFSPNGDGVNDVFRVKGIGSPSIFEMRIYNRWGNLLFMSQDMSKGWDGNNAGKPQEVGTYTVMIRYVDENKQIISKKGTLTLVR